MARKSKNTILTDRKFNDFPSIVKENAEIYGDLPVYSYYEGKEIVQISYKDFYENILALGTSFAKLGLSGKTIAVIGMGHAAYMETYHASVWSGGIIVPMDKEISDEELVNFLKVSDASAIVYTPDQLKRFESLREKITNVDYFISVDQSATKINEKCLYFNDLILEGKELLSQNDTSFTDTFKDGCDVEKCSAIIFSSGTTGTSKGIMLSQKNICSNTVSCIEAFTFVEKGTKILSVLPMNHTYEVTTVHFAAQALGTHTMLNNSLKYVLRNMKIFAPDLLILVPLFVQTIMKKIQDELKAKGLEKKVAGVIKMSDALLKTGIDLRGKLFGQIIAAFGGNLRYIVCGGAPLGKDAVGFFKSIGVDILEGYGITECSPLVAVNRLNDIKPGSVGIPAFGCQVMIDKESEDAETGEILVKGDNVMLGYFNNTEATEAVFTQDGWFKTGDIGFTDKKGRIYITGRKKNVIILSNGKNIFPEEIEEYLGKCEQIAECVVVGKDNKLGETVITALVFPNYDLFVDKTDEEVLEAIKDSVDKINKKLPTYKQVHSVEIRRTEFEKTTSRKIKRYKAQ